mmetsp:Transcript_65/g.107  ORF Transcript_65/g.107 Transcript_65/m.107 type:complete len:278 (-) Transcript_65:17-850(-)
MELGVKGLMRTFVRQNFLQSLFLLVLALLVPLMGWFLKDWDSTFSKTSLSELRGGCVWVAGLFVSVCSLKYFLLPFCRKSITVKLVGKLREERAQKLTNEVFKGVFFTLSFGAGCYLLVTGEGLGSFLDMHFGYNVFWWLVHILSSPRKDFVEVLLHHTVTVILVALGNLLGLHYVSVLVLNVHSIPEIFVSLTKIFYELGCRLLFRLSLGVLVISWGYLRLWFCSVHILYNQSYSLLVDNKSYLVLNLLMHVVLCLNLYWFYFLVKKSLRGFLSNY